MASKYQTYLSDTPEGVAASGRSDDRLAQSQRQRASADAQREIADLEFRTNMRGAWMNVAAQGLGIAKNYADRKRVEGAEAEMQDVANQSELARGADPDYQQSLANLAQAKTNLESTGMFHEYDSTALDKEFTSQMASLNQAQFSGALNKDEVLDRVADIVKKYSASDPQQADKYRQAGANVTGVSRIDSYAMNKWLTQKSLEEETAKRRQQQNEQFFIDGAKDMRMTVAEFARSPKAQAEYREMGNIARRLQVAQARAGMHTVDVQLHDANVEKVVAATLAASYTGIDKSISELYVKAGTAGSTAGQVLLDSDKLSLLKKIEEARLINLQALEQNATNPSGIGISSEYRDRAIKRINQQFETFRKTVEEGGNLSLLSTSLKAMKSGNEAGVESFRALAPLNNLAVEFRLYDKLLPMWFDSPIEFKKRYGEPMYNSMQSLFDQGKLAPATNAVTEVVKDPSIDADAALKSIRASLGPEAEQYSFGYFLRQMSNEDAPTENWGKVALIGIGGLERQTGPQALDQRSYIAESEKLFGSRDSVFFKNLAKQDKPTQQQIVSKALDRTARITHDALTTANKEWMNVKKEASIGSISVPGAPPPSAGPKAAAEWAKKSGEIVAEIRDKAQLIWVPEVRRFTVGLPGTEWEKGGAEDRYGFLARWLHDNRVSLMESIAANHIKWSANLSKFGSDK